MNKNYTNNQGGDYPPNYAQPQQQPGYLAPVMPVYQPIAPAYPQKVQPQGINNNGTDMNESVDNKLNDDGGSKKDQVLPPMQYQQYGYVT